ncbi:hypothetical protein MUP07_00855 [Candidatus Bathyarchaeota archaeon]|nr:hypothetical protein [Candidatus Bathyarchaeota archaeon]
MRLYHFGKACYYRPECAYCYMTLLLFESRLFLTVLKLRIKIFLFGASDSRKQERSFNANDRPNKRLV